MSDAEFHAKLRAHRAHMAAVPVALEAARAVTADWVPDDASPVDRITAGQLRTLIAEVDRLTALEKQLRQDMRDEQREFQREARDIAAEATWQERERHHNDGGY